jgi:hypothetical protein
VADSERLGQHHVRACQRDRVRRQIARLHVLEHREKRRGGEDEPGREEQSLPLVAGQEGERNGEEEDAAFEQEVEQCQNERFVTLARPRRERHARETLLRRPVGERGASWPTPRLALARSESRAPPRARIGRRAGEHACAALPEARRRWHVAHGMTKRRR